MAAILRLDGMRDHILYQREEQAWKGRVLLAMGKILVAVQAELLPEAVPELQADIARRLEDALDRLHHMRFPSGHRFSDWIWGEARAFMDQWATEENGPDPDTLDDWTGNRLLECLMYALFEAPRNKWPDISGLLDPGMLVLMDRYRAAHASAIDSNRPDSTKH